MDKMSGRVYIKIRGYSEIITIQFLELLPACIIRSFCSRSQ